MERVKMSLIGFSLLLCCLLLASNISSHSQGNYAFESFSTKNGLASSEITSILQASNGYLWVGHSAGVSRFNGRKFLNFSSVEGKQLGRTYAIFEYESQIIFFGTENGLFFFHNGSVQEISMSKDMLSVYSIEDNEEGGLWLGTSDGPVGLRRDAVTNSIKTKRITIDVELSWNKYFGQPNPAVYSSLSKDGSIFFADGYEVVRLYDESLDKIWKSNHLREQVNAIVAINKDTAFIAGSSSIYAWYNDSLVQLHTFNEGINSMIKSEDELILFTPAGLKSFNPFSGKIDLIFSLPSSMQKWGNRFIQDINGNFWLAMFDQLLLIKPIVFQNNSHFPGSDLTELYSIRILDGGKIYCGTTRGRVLVSTDSGKSFQLYKKIFNRSPVVDFIRNNKDLWITSWFEGLVRIRNGQLQRFTKAEGLRDNSNFVFVRVGERLFTAGDAGISEIIEEDNRVSFKNFRHNTGSSNYASIRSSVVTKDNEVFFGSSMGLFQLRNDSLVKIQIKNAPEDFAVTDMSKDDHNRIWIATAGSGILICDAQGQQLVLRKHIGEDAGLISNIVLKIMNANESMMAAGYSGISVIDTNYNIRNLGIAQGFIDRGFHYITMEKDRNGMIWFATTAGLFSMQAGEENRSAPFINIIGAEIIGDSTRVYDGINLKYNQNSIKIKIDGVDFTDPGKIQYSYRLIGFDTSWSEPLATDQLMFQNLPHGNYVFEVVALSGDGNTSNIASMSFTILQPLWKSWWFRLFVAALLMAIIIAFTRWRILRVRRKAKAQSRIQKEITANLSHLLEMEQVINYFATSIAANETEEGLLWDVAEKCIGRLGFEDCVIYILDKNRNTLVQKAAMGAKTASGRQISNPIEIGMGQGIVGYVATSRRAEVIPDTTIDKRYLVDDSQRNSEIAVPIISHGELIGVIDSESSVQNFYTDRHLQILKTIAALCADKIMIIRSAEQRKAAEIEAIRNHQRALEARLQSLRLQMNPHFLFNALNSIQQLILTGDETVAAKSLSRFSRLLRLVLVYSEKEKVSLADEMNILNLYLELESLRFGDTFSYSIHIDEVLDPDEVTIPPLIIQPFVENAIWHGLLHKEGKRELGISFTQLSDDLLQCEIIDNGIGRKNAAKFKTHGNSLHTGKGISTSTDRLKLFSEQTQNKCELTINDVVDDKGIISGTRVVLVISF